MSESLRPGSRMSRRKAIHDNEGDASANDDEDLNIRIQEKGITDPEANARKSRLGNMLKEGPSIKGLRDGAAETFKRPLTSLFRRPGTQAGRKKEEEEDNSTSQPPTNFRGTPKITSTLEDVVLNDDSPRDREQDAGSSSTRTNFGVEGIARAPMMSSAKLHPMLGDDGPNAKLAYLSKVDDIDVSILARHLLLEEDCEEEDTPWTWDHLYASLSSELREEWAADNEISLSARIG